jgi:hypothetical protein
VCKFSIRNGIFYAPNSIKNIATQNTTLLPGWMTSGKARRRLFAIILAKIL